MFFNFWDMMTFYGVYGGVILSEFGILINEQPSFVRLFVLHLNG
jgi:hypothetical protein